MPQPPKKAEPTDALWEHVTQLHKKLGELAVQVAGGAKDPLQDAIAAVGMVQGLQAVFEPLRAAIERDAAHDAAVGQQLAEVAGELRALREEMCASRLTNERMCAVLEVLASPRTRTGRVNLPGGPVEMMITEAHEGKKGH